MELFVNDLSLHAQFPAPADFRPALHELLSCQRCAKSFNRACYVPHSISKRMVTANQTFRQAVGSIGDLNITRLVRSWIDQQGPFADDVLTRDDSEYYWHCDEDNVVTEEMLGEVAARHFSERPAALVSFVPSDFVQSPLTVTWHRDNSPAEPCDLDNFWESSTLHRFLEQHEADVQSWQEMLTRARTRYTNLIFLDTIEQYLAGEPFNDTIARRALELLHILNQIKGSYTPTGQRTEEGERLVDNYFRRKNAVFTNASDMEKNDPSRRAAMTFRSVGGAPIECFWHGKISHRYFRIHFSPLVPEQPLYIAYIGPHT